VALCKHQSLPAASSLWNGASPGCCGIFAGGLLSGLGNDLVDGQKKYWAVSLKNRCLQGFRASME